MFRYDDVLRYPERCRRCIDWRGHGGPCTMTIYIVDDHPLMRDAIASLLRRLRPDMQVVELGCLADVRPARVAHGPPQVIFLDLNLPDAAGCNGVQQIKASLPNVPLAVYSASPATEMAKRCLEAGADLYVEKTTDTRNLAAALRSLLAPSLVQATAPACTYSQTL